MAQIINMPDPDTLSKLLENLKLENDLPELSGSLNILEELSTADEKNDTEKSVVVKQENIDENIIEEISCLQQAAEDIVIGLKNKNDGKSYTIKSEVFSDEEVEDNSTVLLERGGPDRTKKRNYKKKGYDRKSFISNAELDKHNLKFSSGGKIIENNSAVLSLQSSHVQHIVPSFNIFNNNFPIQYQGINAVKSREITSDASERNIISLSSEQQIQSPTDFTNVNFSASSPEIGFINSPESGYDTSHSSGVYSPSPPSAELQLLNEELEKEIAIQTIVNTFLEIERDLKTSKSARTPDIVDYAINSYGNILPNDVNDNFSVENLECENLEKIIELVDNSTNIQTAVSLPPLTSTTSTHDDKHKLKKNSKERKISIELKEVAKYHLRFSEFFVENNYKAEEEELLRSIKYKQPNKEEFNVIDIEENEDSMSKPNVVANQTNLQKAIIQQKIEKIFCLVEAHKKFCSSLSLMINHKDTYKKTALDYAVQMNMPLVVNYLKENLAIQGISLD